MTLPSQLCYFFLGAKGHTQKPRKQTFLFMICITFVSPPPLLQTPLCTWNIAPCGACSWWWVATPSLSHNLR